MSAERLAHAKKRIETAIAGATSGKARLKALEPLPGGHAWLHAILAIDTEVKASGFDKYYKATGGVEIPQALVGLRRMDRNDVTAVIEESLAYGRTKKRPRVDPELIDEPRIAKFASPRPWGQLDDVYAALAFDAEEALGSFIDGKLDLFEPEYTELICPEDGRLWRIRRNGWTNDIEIVFGDGTTLVRERRCVSLVEAERDAKTLIAEQLKDGFIRGK